MEKKRKVLIIAPHPDDEINLAGQMLVHFQKQNLELCNVYDKWRCGKKDQQ